MTTDDTRAGLRQAAHKAMDAYLDAGGTEDFVIISRKDMERNTPELDDIIDTCLHPERNGLLIKEAVAEGANYEWLIKRELKAAIDRYSSERATTILEQLKQRLPDPNNNVEEWRGHNLGLSQALHVIDEAIEALTPKAKGEQ